MKEIEYRSYTRNECCIFWKTQEAYGGLSNMAPGYPLLINDTKVLTVEALYQACKFPHLPDLQYKIIHQSSPIFAKKVGKPYEKEMRPDWMQIRTTVMKWSLHIKLIQNWGKFSELLLSTGEKPIVEFSEKDDFWGALPWGPNELHGRNVLGRLLMDLRHNIVRHPNRKSWKSGLPNIQNFKLLGSQIKTPPLSNGNTEDFSNMW